MATIKYQPTVTRPDGNPIPSYFYIEILDNSAEFLILKAAFNAALDANWLSVSKQQERVTIQPNPTTVRALYATGFDWELDAATSALGILVNLVKKASYVNIGAV